MITSYSSSWFMMMIIIISGNWRHSLRRMGGAWYRPIVMVSRSQIGGSLKKIEEIGEEYKFAVRAQHSLGF